MEDFDLEIDAPSGPIKPQQLTLDNKLQFNCYEGISCFNECCKSIDITLTPYDILRLKKRTGYTAEGFLLQYATTFDMDPHGLQGVKLGHKEGTTECVFLAGEGCDVYEDRPTACRYYPLGIVAMRKKDASHEEDFYFLVKEDHCKGHEEPNVQTVGEYRKEQGVEFYDDMNREWRQIILKKKSAGQTVGQPSKKSLDLFFLASYDIEQFQKFVISEQFLDAYKLDPELVEKLRTNEQEVMLFGFRFLKQVLFGEMFIKHKEGAREKRVERLKARAETMKAAAEAQDKQAGDEKSR